MTATEKYYFDRSREAVRLAMQQRPELFQQHNLYAVTAEFWPFGANDSELAEYIWAETLKAMARRGAA